MSRRSSNPAYPCPTEHVLDTDRAVSNYARFHNMDNSFENLENMLEHAGRDSSPSGREEYLRLLAHYDHEVQVWRTKIMPQQAAETEQGLSRSSSREGTPRSQQGRPSEVEESRSLAHPVALSARQQVQYRREYAGERRW
ncbi:hypothetical protein JCM10207_005840 [Rhodosporidiobolus poonsookiae]